MIGTLAFAAALGWSLSSFYRARDAGRLPQPCERTQGGRMRWTPEVASSFVRKWGKKPPREWEARARRAA